VARSPSHAYARPEITFDEVLALDEAGVTIRVALGEDAPCFRGHYPGHPIFPGVFSVELVRQAARLYCDAYRPGARLRTVSARFISPIMPGSEVVCECRRLKAREGEGFRIKGACIASGVASASVTLDFATS
jgi:3-hydroxyacyl-[acyl-carrier-protein] dehydratase